MSSTKKPISQKRADKERTENRTLNRVYYVFLLGLAAECYLFMVYQGYAWGTVNSMLTWHTILTVATWLGLAMLIGGLAAGYLKRQDRKIRTIAGWVGGVGAFFALSSWIITHFFSNNAGVTAMCIMVPILAVLALVYLLYQHECALSTVVLSGAMFSVWLRGASAYSDQWRIPVVAGCVVVVAGLAVVMLLANRARQNGGKLRGVRVFSLECDYRIVFAVLAVAALCVLLAAVAPAITFYLMWALGVLLFAELVYYTTKLM